MFLLSNVSMFLSDQAMSLMFRMAMVQGDLARWQRLPLEIHRPNPLGEAAPAGSLVKTVHRRFTSALFCFTIIV